MAEYIEVNGRQIRVRPTDSQIILQKDSDPGKIR